MNKPIDKPAAFCIQPIDAIGLCSSQPIAPIDNPLTLVCAIGLETQIPYFIYIYKIYIYLLTYYTHPRPRTRKTRVYTRTRGGKVNQFNGSFRRFWTGDVDGNSRVVIHSLFWRRETQRPTPPRFRQVWRTGVGRSGSSVTETGAPGANLCDFDNKP